MGSLGQNPTGVNVTMNNNNSSGPATLNTNGLPMSNSGVTVLNKPIGLIPGTQQLQHQSVIGPPGSSGTVVVTTSLGGTVLSSSGSLATSGHQQFISTSGGGIQLVNMNSVRAAMTSGAGAVTMGSGVGGTPTKSMAPRMLLGQQVIGARAGQPGVS